MGHGLHSGYYTEVPARRDTAIAAAQVHWAALWGWGCGHCGCSSLDDTCGPSGVIHEQGTLCCPIPQCSMCQRPPAAVLGLTWPCTFILASGPQSSCSRSAMLWVQRGKSQKKRRVWVSLGMAAAPTSELARAAVSICRAAESQAMPWLSIQSRMGLSVPQALPLTIL